jgi:hypothetical protein
MDNAPAYGAGDSGFESRYGLFLHFCLLSDQVCCLHFDLFGFDHINRNAPVLIRTPKLTRFEPAQYWGGGPPGNSVVLNPIFSFWHKLH